MRYVVSHNQKNYTYCADNAIGAAEKFGARKVFGNPAVFGLTLDQYDAETRGEQWAEYHTADGARVHIERVA